MPINTLINALKCWTERTFATNGELREATTVATFADKVLLDMTVSTTNGGGSSGMHSEPFEGFKPEVGKEYKVVFDGVEYTEVAELFRGADYFGKEGIISVGYDENIYCDPSGVPFVYLHMPETDEAYVYSTSWGDHHIAVVVEEGMRVVKRLSDAFNEIEASHVVTDGGNVIYEGSAFYSGEDGAPGMLFSAVENNVDIRPGREYVLKIGDLERRGVAKKIEYEGGKPYVYIGDYNMVDDDFYFACDYVLYSTSCCVFAERPDLDGSVAVVAEAEDSSVKVMQDAYEDLYDRTSVTNKFLIDKKRYGDDSTMQYSGYVDGIDYLVMFDGEQYGCKCVKVTRYDSSFARCVGNLSIAPAYFNDMPEDTGEPFLIMDTSDGATVYSADKNYHNYKVYICCDKQDIASAFESLVVGTPDPIGIAGSATGSEVFNTTENTASGGWSHAEGYSTTAKGDYSHAEGRNTQATNVEAHAEGSGSKATGWTSHAEGNGTTASGSCSHAEGSVTTASGKWSHAEGVNSVASGETAHAEGNATEASGSGAHSEGHGTKATNQGAHAEGGSTKASKAYSHAEGFQALASSMYQHVQGKYNVEDTASTYAHIVGNGTSTTARSNAHTLDWDGNAWYAGTVEGTAMIVKSPNGTRYQITVSDSGAISATAM